MRPTENIKKLIQNISIKTNPKVNKAVLNSLFDEQDKLRKTSAILQPGIWRTIMRGKITKFAVAAAIIIAAVLTINTFHKPIPIISTASAAQLLTEAAKAVEDVRSIHIRARMRTLAHDNFASIGLDYDFVPIEMWKKMDDAGILRWRIEKPERVVVTDGNSTTMLIRTNYAVGGEHPYPIGCFDTWCGHLLNVDGLIDNALKTTMNQVDDQLCMYSEMVKDGTELVLEIESTAEGDYTNDYLKNKFISDSDHKTVYRFDAETKLLKGFEIYVHTDKEDVLVFEVTDIEYNPEIDNALFTLKLPKDVVWHEEPKDLGDKYQQMGPKEVAEVFFKACSEENWDEFLKFWPMSVVDEGLKRHLGGLEVISLGEPFKSGKYPGWFIPYEIRLKNGTIRKHNLAVRNDNPARRYIFDGGI
jgi:outer membrane lipoprotein-sorting protein